MQELSNKEKVWQVVASVPRGKVSTYGDIARLAALPNSARFVGTVLKNLPTSTNLPWHRIINSQGKISFPENSDSYKVQRQRLESEGIHFKNNKVSLRDYSWVKTHG